MSDQNNVWESANNAQVPTQHYFGELTLDPWPCVLVKGPGKVKFDPMQHAGQKQFTAINLSIFVPNPNGQSFNIERSMIAESKEWAGTILPSIHAVGLTPMTINKKWCHVEMVKTGTYVKKGETEVKDLTNPRIVAVYNSEQEAEAAAAAFFGKSEEQAFDHTVPASNGDLHPAAPGNNAIEAFVNALYTQAQGDLAKLEIEVRRLGMDWDSLEVQTAIAKKTAVVPF